MFLNGIATITAGGTGEVEATWMLPIPPSAFASATAKWEVLDRTGAVWSFGDADTLRTETAAVGTDTHVIATATVTVPVEAPADPSGTSYQVRWTLTRPGADDLYAFDGFTLFPRVADLLGPANSVVLAGTPTQVHLTLPTEFPDVRCMVYYQNTALTEIVATKQLVTEGHRYLANLLCDWSPGPSLYPYTLIWRYGPANQQVMEQASLWLINPTIMQAQAEIRQFLVKAYLDSGIDPGQDFTPDVMLLHLQQGAELFNALGYPTTFTMTRATGPIRALWLRCATIAACRAQYLSEGMKAFNFGGQVVNLDVDRSQFWDSIASQLQAELDQAIKPFKENLVRRGLLSGDGNINPNTLMHAAVGSIGIAITPVSPIRGVSSFAGLVRRR